MVFFLTTIVQWRWLYDDHNDDDDDCVDDDDDDHDHDHDHDDDDDDDDGGSGGGGGGGGVCGDAMSSPGVSLGTDEVGVGVMTTTTMKVAIFLALMWIAVI